MMLAKMRYVCCLIQESIRVDTGMKTELMLVLMLLMALVSACGQKGPLYLPDDPVVRDTQAAVPAEAAHE